MDYRLAALTPVSLTVIFMLFTVCATANTDTARDNSTTIVITVLDNDYMPVEDGLKFILLEPSGERVLLETRDGRLEASVVLGSRLVGPLVEDGRTYLPVDISILKLLPYLDSEPAIVLQRASIVRFIGLYPWIDGSPVSARYRLELWGAGLWYPSEIHWSHSIDVLKRLIGLGDGEILVPQSIDYRLYGEFAVVGGEGLRWMEDLTGLIGENRIVSLLHTIYPRAFGAVQNFTEVTGYRLQGLSQSGIYLGYQLDRLKKAEERLAASREHYLLGNMGEAYQLLRKTYIDLVGINSALNDYSVRWGGGILLPLFLVLGALSLSHLVLGEKKSSIAAGLSLLSIFTFSLIAASHPSILPSDAWGWSALLYSILVIVGLVWSIPALGLEVKTQRGVALLAASSLAFSVAKRFLKTRPLRTWMMVAMATITVSATLLLVNIGVESEVFVSNPTEKVNPVETPYIIVYDRGYRFDNLAPVDTRYVEFFRSLGLDLGLRAETPIFPPSGREYIINDKSYNLRGVIGVSGSTLLPKQLSQCIIEGEINRIGQDPSASIVSSDLAANLGLTVGSWIRVNGVILQIDGILSTDCPTYLKDIDGYFLSTLVMPPMSPVAPAGWSNVIITGFDGALKLGALPTKIYASGGGVEEIDRIAETMSLHTNLKVRLIRPGGEVYVFNLVSLASISGGEVMVVAGIAFLNLLVASLANYYERRGEFLTMSTLGLNPAHILLLSVAEAIFLGVISSYLGVLVTLGVFSIVPKIIPIPIDFKLTQESVMGVFALSSVIFISSHILSVRRNIILSTPAQTWKWVLTKALDEEGYWTVELPAKLKVSKIKHFITYMNSRLSEYSYTTTVNIMVHGVEENTEAGLHRLRFTYSSTEQRAFRASCILDVYEQDGWGFVKLRSKIEAQDARFIDQYVREIVQLIRQFIIEYTSLTIRILVPFSRDLAHIQPLLTVYNPSEVRVVWRGASEDDLKREVEMLEANLVRVVVVRIPSSGSMVSDAKAVIEAAKDCDLICISSDDGYLSSIALLAAQRLSKRICIIRDSEVLETTPTSLWEQLR